MSKAAPAAIPTPVPHNITPTIAPARSEARQTTLPSSAATETPKTPAPGSKEYRKAYGSAARKWTATMVAMPILLVTSYFLFDRLALGHEPKVMPDFDKAKKQNAEQAEAQTA
ncbi:hypothetical protein K4K58_005097 [Colletotrichum sp. SAR11_239]|nr:hypothetical protein K4K58_005097 [Colletotrichum sp. SAR11_239]